MNREQIHQAAEESVVSSLEELRNFLKIPNNGNFPEHIQSNLEWCKNTFQSIQFDTKILTTEGAPQLYAERIYDPGLKSLLFYLQIDGQPVDTSFWNQENPYLPVLKVLKKEVWEEIDWDKLKQEFNPDWRIFARSASDSKGPAIAFMTALDILNKRAIQPDFNIKVIMDFQEELGSPTLATTVDKHRALLQSEMLLIMDGTRHLSNLPTLTFGARGIATVTIKVFGAKRNLHSGQYGNFAPNPVFKLSKLIAGMKDEEGKVTIPGFYDGINLSQERKDKINDVPEDLLEIKKSLGIADIDRVGETYQEALQYPSLNVRGLRAAWVGEEVRTLIPSLAIAEIDMRLVPESGAMRQITLLRNYVLNQGYHLVDSIPTAEERRQYAKLASFQYRIGSKPFRTDFDSSIGKWLSSAMQRTFGDKFVRMSTTGGSQPIAPFINTLGIPAVSLRIPNPDNNIHAPNENLRLGNFLEGIQMCLGVLTEEMK
ncbi:M20/M25/M40 family metallo-hydrolase [Fulvivirgaceae bacterium BMA10]|uniref:M20/M25/M40 family metallo-hydrolase n=1 Tax=Splendidivirga corallicola TaxID=3051826 RepID=A0ABT8KJC6_9BACT|nr:M20/M25/M40 family metallo-hydrolase [Fulvivirgaceae bacterium BMA10]